MMTNKGYGLAETLFYLLLFSGVIVIVTFVWLAHKAPPLDGRQEREEEGNDSD